MRPSAAAAATIARRKRSASSSLGDGIEGRRHRQRRDLAGDAAAAARRRAAPVRPLVLQGLVGEAADERETAEPGEAARDPPALARAEQQPGELISAASARPGFLAMNPSPSRRAVRPRRPAPRPAFRPCRACCSRRRRRPAIAWHRTSGLSLLVSACRRRSTRSAGWFVRRLSRPPNRRGSRASAAMVRNRRRRSPPGGHPGAADAEHVRQARGIRRVASVEAAGRAEARLRQRADHGLQPGGAAGRDGGEELQELEAEIGSVIASERVAQPGRAGIGARRAPRQASPACRARR